MNTFIALFRGINVGGNSTLPMSDLKSLLETLECLDVRTYIQSGNVVFKTSFESGEELASRIAHQIHGKFGFMPIVLLLGLDELERAIANNPFTQGVDAPQSLHIGFLASTPTNPDLSKLVKLKSENEQFRLIGNVFYLFAPDGVGRSKLAAGAESALGVPMTDRNWRTVRKILEIATKEVPA